MSPGSAGRGTYQADCPHSHLFRGERVLIRGLPDPLAYAASPTPLDLDLRFSDGASTDAELVVSATGGAALTVTAYTTVAGTALPDRTWLVQEVRVSGDEAEAVVGSRLR